MSGIKAFVEYLSRAKTPIHQNVFYFLQRKMALVLKWRCCGMMVSRKRIAFTNIPQRDGGT